MNQGLTAKGPPNVHLWFGSLVHVSLAEWYLTGTKRGLAPAKTFEREYSGQLRVIKAAPGGGELWDDTVYMDAGDLGVAMLEAYVKIYGLDPAWSFIATEEPAKVTLLDPKTKEPSINYFYTLDGVYRNLETNEIECIDHKTCARIVTSHLELDDQAGSYWAVAATRLRRLGILAKEEQISGITYNFLRKAMPDVRPRNSAGQALNKPRKKHYIEALAGTLDAATLGKMKLEDLDAIAINNGIAVEGEVSETQGVQNFHRELVTRRPSERATQIRRITDEFAHMSAMRNGSLPIYKVPRQSGYDACQNCSFFQMCILHESKANWESYRDRMYNKVEDPYADYKKSAYEGT